MSERLRRFGFEQIAVVRELHALLNRAEAKRALHGTVSRMPRSAPSRERFVVGSGRLSCSPMSAEAHSFRMQRLGVYGGSFDPPHVAHVLAAAYALAVGDLDRVIVVPVFSHAFHKQLAPFEHRVRMCELAFADLDRVEISSIEARLPEPSRTLHTLKALRKERRDVELRLIVGGDVLSEASKWHAFDAITTLAPLFVIGRSGHERPETAHFALPAVSSSRVRELLASRDPENNAELRELVPRKVLAYARERALYPRRA